VTTFGGRKTHFLGALVGVLRRNVGVAHGVELGVVVGVEVEVGRGRVTDSDFSEVNEGRSTGVNLAQLPGRRRNPPMVLGLGSG
jgi:hypothetical protein